MLPPLDDLVWSHLLRGVAFGFVGGLVLILLFFFTYKLSGLLAVRPGSLVYVIVGIEIGVALAGTVLFVALHYATALLTQPPPQT